MATLTKSLKPKTGPLTGPGFGFKIPKIPGAPNRLTNEGMLSFTGLGGTGGGFGGAAAPAPVATGTTPGAGLNPDQFGLPTGLGQYTATGGQTAGSYNPALQERAGLYGGLLLAPYGSFGGGDMAAPPPGQQWEAGQWQTTNPLEQQKIWQNFQASQFLEERNRVLGEASNLGLFTTPEFAGILGVPGMSEQDKLAAIDTLNQAGAVRQQILMRNPAIADSLPDLATLTQTLNTIAGALPPTVAGQAVETPAVRANQALMNLVSQYGSIVFELSPGELTGVVAAMNAQASDPETGQALYDENGTPILLPLHERELMAASIFEARETDVRLAENREEAIATLRAQLPQLDALLGRLNDPQRQALMDTMLDRATQPAVSQDEIDAHLRGIDAVIRQHYGTQQTQTAQALAGSGLGRSSFAYNLAREAQHRSAQAKISARDELFTWQQETDRQVQQSYTDMFLRYDNADTAMAATIQGMMLGVNEQIAQLQAGQTFMPIDLSPLAAMISSFGESIQAREDELAALNPDLISIFMQSISSALTQFIPTWITGAISSNLPSLG